MLTGLKNLRSIPTALAHLAASVIVLCMVGCGGSTTSSPAVVRPPTVPPSLFGIHILLPATPFPTMNFSGARLWGSPTRWAQVEKSGPGTFDFGDVDLYLAKYYSGGINDIVYTFGGVPQWASTNPNDLTCDGAVEIPGGCWLPDDINADGGGTDQTYITFVTALAQHVNDPTYLQTHAHIGYWEPWNEWYRNPVVNTYTWSSYSIHATYAQMVRMTEDMRCVITGTGSVNGTPCTATAIDPSAKVISPSDGGLACCGSPQVFQNFLYCNNDPTQGGTLPNANCTTGTRGSAAVDIINSHFYLPYGMPAEALASIAAGYDALLSPTDLAKPLWSDEGSWGKNNALPDPDVEASWVARYYLIGWSSGFSQMFWYAYDAPDTGTLWTPSGLTPAGQAFGTTYKWVVGSKLSGPCSATGTVWTCNLTLGNGTTAEVMWDTSQNCSNGNCTSSPQAISSTWTNYQDLTGANHTVTTSGSVPVGIKPILLTPSATSAP